MKKKDKDWVDLKKARPESDWTKEQKTKNTQQETEKSTPKQTESGKVDLKKATTTDEMNKSKPKEEKVQPDSTPPAGPAFFDLKKGHFQDEIDEQSKKESTKPKSPGNK